MKNTVTTFQAMKDKGEKISMLTAYDYSTAKLEDAAEINGILVGDSLGNVVLECVPAKLARKVTEALHIPTIGIGAGEGCDGQILVYADMLSMFSDFTPKFVRSFANVGEIMSQAFKDYDAAVKDSSFPAQEHTFKIADEVLDKLY